MTDTAANRIYPDQSIPDGVHRITDAGEFFKWDETLAQHNAIHIPSAPPKPTKDDPPYLQDAYDQVMKTNKPSSIHEYFKDPAIMKQLESDGITKQELPNGSVILRKPKQAVPTS